MLDIKFIIENKQSVEKKLTSMGESLDFDLLDNVSTSMTINATAPILLAFYIVAAEKKGIRPEKLKGTVQNDILKEFMVRNTYIYPSTCYLLFS